MSLLLTPLFGNLPGRPDDHDNEKQRSFLRRNMRRLDSGQSGERGSDFFEEELFVFHQRLAVTHFRDEHFDIHTQPPFHISQQTRLKGHCLQAQPKLGKKLSRSMA